jgi:Cys-rich repeat protein
MLSSRWNVWMLVGCLSLAACGPGSPGGVDAQDAWDGADGDQGEVLCELDQDCPAGERCVHGVCRPEGFCLAHPDCPPGMLCNQLVNRCVQAECVLDADCGPGKRCQAGACELLCERIECPAGERCQPENGLCSRMSCTVGSAGCESDGDCRAGLYCDPIGRGCTECPPAFFCNFHLCYALQAECQVHSDCGSGERCSPTARRCEPFPETCSSDSACAPRYCNLFTHTCQVDPFTGDCSLDVECQAVYGYSYYCHPRLLSCVLPLVSGECYDSEDCADPELVCNPKDNACVPLGSFCSQDSDCPQGHVCLASTCVFQCQQACQTDAECLNGFVCRNGCCIEDLSCTRDSDCPSGQVCQAGWCSPACGVDDDYEENDDSSTAAPLQGLVPHAWVEFPGLVVCRGDQDWYAIEVPARTRLFVEVAFSHSQGDIDIGLYDAAGGVSVDSSSGTGNLEQVDAPQATVDKVYHLKVYLFSGSSNGYTVRVKLEPVVDPCTTDDPFENNDVPRDATPLVLPAFGQAIEFTGLTVCGADYDWYQVEAPSGARVEFSIHFTHANGNLQLEAYLDPALPPVATSTTTNSVESLVFQPVANTTYLFRVYGQAGAGNVYTLRLGHAAPACLGDDAFEPNDTSAQAVVLDLPAPGPDEYPGLVSCLDNQDWYAFPLQAGDTLRVRIDFTHSQGDIEMQLLGPTGASLASSTSSSNYETVEVTHSTAGLHRVRVYHYSGSSGRTNGYQMTVTYFPGGVDPTCADDPLEPNNTAASASPLGQSLAQAVVCGGNQDWYAIPVSAGEWVRVLVDYLPETGKHLAVTLFGPNGTTQLGTDTGSASRRSLQVVGLAQSAGLFYLRAQLGSPGPSDRATYQVLVVRSGVDCQDLGFEPNNSAAAAAPLELGDYGGLAVCKASPADLDWYRIGIGAWERLRVLADSNPSDGNLGLSLFQADGVTSVATSDAGGAREQVAGPRVASPTSYLVRVRNLTTSGVTDLPYRLSAWVDPPPDCEDDALEENDLPAQAMDWTGERLEGVLCHVDTDWFALDVPARHRLLLTAAYDPAVASLDLRAYQSDGSTLIAASTSHTGLESLDRRLASDTRVLVQVAMFQPADTRRLPYALEALLEAPQECLDDALEPNNDLNTASPLLAPDSGELVLCPADADLFAFQAHRGGRYTFRLVNLAGRGDADLYLLDAAGAQLRSSTLTGTTTEVIANQDSLYEQRYHLRVVPKNLLADDIIDYRLEVVDDAFTPCDDDAFEPNDTAATAGPLDSLAWQPLLDRWALAIDGLYACKAGPADWYSFELVEGTNLSATVSFPTNRNADVFLYAPDGVALLASSAANQNPEVVSFGAFGAPADGRYLLKVVAKNLSTANDFAYSLQLESDRAFICRQEPFDPFEPNGSPAEALAGTHLGAGEYAYLTLCGAEEDWYALEALTGQQVTVRASFHPMTDIDVYLYGADGATLLDASEGVTGLEQVSATAVEDGPVFVRLHFNKHHPTWVAPYDLLVDVSDP